MIFDTHAHYDDEVFDADRDELIKGFSDKNVEAVVNVGATFEGCLDTLKLIKEYPNVYGALGIHPSEILPMDDEKLEFLKAECTKNAVYNGGKIVAVGEIGLDYHYPEPSKELQKEWFIKQIDMAREVKLPMIVHSRDASSDTFDIMKDMKAEEVGGIVHCYSYSKEMAQRFLTLGFYFGIGGVITFKNARKLVETVEYLPMDVMVLETDSPYLAPVPLRGERNNSANIKYVAEKIAEIKHMDVDEVIDITNKNAKRVYRINADA